MSMSTYIQAFIPDTDPTYQKHKKVLLACIDAGIEELPKETSQYFGYKTPEREALEEKLKVELREGVHYKDYNEDMSQGFEIELKDIPQGVTKLRFVNSY